MNIFKRLFKIGQAEANSAIDNMEDPIKLTEQGIRDLRTELEKSLESLAQVKALAIRSNNDFEDYTSEANEYKNKAIALLTQAKNGTLDSNEADRLAKEALLIKEEALEKAKHAKTEHASLQESIDQLEKNCKQLKNNISNYENELKTLKARVKVSKAKSSLNKQMAEIDQTGTVAMLERMKEKIAQEEALADAYSDIADKNKSIKDEIDNAIDSTDTNANNELEQLKKQLGINNEEA